MEIIKSLKFQEDQKKEKEKRKKKDVPDSQTCDHAANLNLCSLCINKHMQHFN